MEPVSVSLWIAVAAAPFVGSFLAVVAVRWPDGQGVVWGRSHCRHCHENLAWYDMIPLLSWLVLRARCRHCQGAIDRIHPVLEISALVLALWAAASVGGAVFWLSCLLGWSLLLIAALDWRHFWVPDRLTIPLALGGVGMAAVLVATGWHHAAIGLIVGYGVFRGIGWTYWRLRGLDGLGGGDAKLLAAGGAWVGWQGLPAVIL